jgi:hypothetical protein
MYHYTYEILYKNGKKYIGVRSSKVEPHMDIKYIGSSLLTDNDMIYIKLILSTFETREEAIKHEMYLQSYNNVIANPIYYNASIQNGTKFSMLGAKFSNEHKKRISISTANAAKEKWTPELKQKLSASKRGVKQSVPWTEERRRHMSEINKGQKSWSKGKSFNNDYVIDKYESRVKHKDKYYWIHMDTQEVKYATCQEMGLMFGKKKSRQFILILDPNKYTKSYHRWKLHTEQSE